jgi:hypothetical protein
VLIALCLFSLVIFMALATNMGILVNDKIRMQNAADMAAYGAAYKEAQRLNVLVEKNRLIVEKVEECRNNLTAQPWDNDCSCEARSELAEQYIDICQGEIENLANDFLLEARWNQTVEPAIAVGMATFEANIPGLTNSGSQIHQGLGSSSQSGVYQVEGTGVNGNTPVASIAPFNRAVSNFNYPVLLLCRTAVGCVPAGIVPSAQTHQLRSWYYKDDTNPDVWVMSEARGTMRSAYLDVAYSASGSDGGYFGASSNGGTDTMVAIAIAKPFGGSVGPAPGVTSTAQRNGNINLAGPYYVSDGTEVAKLAMVDEYRARLAGFHEWSWSLDTTNGATADTNPRDAILSISQWSSHAGKFRH